MTTYSLKASCLHLSQHPFPFTLPLQPPNFLLLHIAIYAKSLFFGLSCSLVLTISASPLLPCLHILHPSLPLILPLLFLPPTYTVMICTFQLPPLACSLLRRQSSSPLYLPSLTQNVTRKGSVNLDTPIKTLLLDLPCLASSHSSTDHVYGSWMSSYSFCFHVPTHHHLLMFPHTLIDVPLS